MTGASHLWDWKKWTLSLRFVVNWWDLLGRLSLGGKITDPKIRMDAMSTLWHLAVDMWLIWLGFEYRNSTAAGSISSVPRWSKDFESTPHFEVNWILPWLGVTCKLAGFEYFLLLRGGLESQYCRSYCRDQGKAVALQHQLPLLQRIPSACLLPAGRSLVVPGSVQRR